MTLEVLESEAVKCTACELHINRLNPVFSKGESTSDIMICGMVPATEENEQGIPFVGKAGKMLDQMLNTSGLTGKVYVTNLVKCFLPAGESLKVGWIESCRHFLDSQIMMIRPKVIITLGADASFTLIGAKDINLGDLRGKVFIKNKIKIIPTYHPSYLMRFGGTSSEEYLNSIEDFNEARRLIHED